MTAALLARIVSIVIVYVAVAKYPTPVMVAITYSVSIAHYLLSYIYSYKQIRSALSQLRSGIMFATLTTVALKVVSVHFPLWSIFSFHHAFNESYTADATTRGERAKFLTTPRILAAFALYLLVQYQMIMPSHSFQNCLIVTLVCASLLSVYLVIKRRLYSSALDLATLALFEFLGFWPLVLCREQGLALWEIALYHVAFWLTYPIPAMAKKGSSKAITYFSLHVALMVAIWQVLPLGSLHWITWEQSMWTFSAFTTMHILHSLSTSDAEPYLLRKIFRPRQTNLQTSHLSSAAVVASNKSVEQPMTAV